MPNGNIIPIPEQKILDFRYMARVDKQLLITIKNEVKSHGVLVCSIDDVGKKIAETHSLNLDEVMSIINIVTNWILVHRRMDLTSEEFLEGATAYLESQSKDVWDDKDRIAWKENYNVILEILSSDNLITLGAKAAELLLEHQLVLCSCRIITDLRPIYNDKATELTSFFIFHTLVARYLDGLEMREIHIALDKDDLELMKKQLERATQKATVLEEKLTKAKLNVVDTNIISHI